VRKTMKFRQPPEKKVKGTAQNVKEEEGGSSTDDENIQ
jgi:hypothetical protein